MPQKWPIYQGKAEPTARSTACLKALRVEAPREKVHLRERAKGIIEYP